MSSHEVASAPIIPANLGALVKFQAVPLDFVWVVEILRVTLPDTAFLWTSLGGLASVPRIVVASHDRPEPSHVGIALPVNNLIPVDLPPTSPTTGRILSADRFDPPVEISGGDYLTVLVTGLNGGGTVTAAIDYSELRARGR